jgi:2-dehydropantoate 2-reductase
MSDDYRVLVVGVGALGGIIGARAVSAGIPVWLATRTVESAAALRSSGLQVSGIGGTAGAAEIQVAAVQEYEGADKFDLILLATKAHDALEIAPFLVTLLAPDGVLLPIQNGSVSQLLANRLGENAVLGGLSNLGATMIEPGIYEQRNAGHLLIGELSGGLSDRAAKVAGVLGKSIEVRVSENLRGAIWAKLILNCSVTTVGAVAGQTMRQYMISVAGRDVFRRAYDEALSTALTIGIQPQRMIVDPVPPGWRGTTVVSEEYNRWVDRVMAGYGDLKPSMLQDFERGRRTEIDFINGYIAELGPKAGVPVPMNAAITELVHLIEQGKSTPDPGRLDELSKRIKGASVLSHK